MSESSNRELDRAAQVRDPCDRSLLRKPPGLSASRWPPEPVPETHLQQLCTTCEETSDQIYKEAWFCLRPDCSSFWKVYSKQPETGLWRQILVNPDSILQYSEDFLVHRSSPASLSIIPFHLDAEQTGRSSSKTRLDGRGVCIHLLIRRNTALILPPLGIDHLHSMSTRGLQRILACVGKSSTSLSNSRYGLIIGVAR